MKRFELYRLRDTTSDPEMKRALRYLLQRLEAHERLLRRIARIALQPLPRPDDRGGYPGEEKRDGDEA